MAKKKTREEFIELSNKKHNNKYDYSKIKYINNKTKVCIICPKHGEFWQTPHDHLRGKGCPECGKIKRAQERAMSTEEFIKKAKQIHGDKYDYSKVEYVNNNTKICIKCNVCGAEFWQTPVNHINRSRPRGCPVCGQRKRKLANTQTTKQFIKKAKQIHGDKYDYSTVDMNNREKNGKIKIICPKHGEFEQLPNSHLQGYGCPKCAHEFVANCKRITQEEFINKSKKVHGDKYDYSKVKYIDLETPVEIICPIHGSFYQKPEHHLMGHGCQKCGRQFSQKEEDLFNFIKSLTSFEVRHNDKKAIKPNEIDVYIPEIKIGFEFDGLYWHSEQYREKNFHLCKTNECLKNSIRLIHIFEDEWDYKNDILKSMIRNLFHITKNKIYARKCEIKEVTSIESNLFLNKNHIQGKCQSSVNLGLYYNDELVSLMTFGKPRINMGGDKSEGSWELVRFCNKIDTRVIGGASKLFKYFVEKYNPNKVISYSDRRWATGGLYEKLGFVHDHDSAPNYYYVIKSHRENRFKYRKDRLIKEGYGPNKSEHEIMLERGIYRIYDCGCKVWVWKKQDS